MKRIFLYLILNFIILNGCEVKSVKENKIPTSPVLNSPSNNATNIKLDAVLNWTASTDQDGDVVKYNVYFGTIFPLTIKVKELQSETSYTPSLKLNTTYYWKIEADDGNGGVSVSEVRNFKTISEPPSTPILTSPVNNAINVSLSTNLEWNPSTTSNGNNAKYNVFLGTSSTVLTKVSSLQTGNTYTTSLQLNTIYYWKIEADDGNGGVSVSEVRNFKTISEPPSTPVLISPINDALNISLSSNLEWNASTTISGNIAKYNVFLDTSKTLLKKVSSMQTATTYTPTKLFSNTYYYWKIEADDGNGGTSASEIKTFKTVLVAPSIPTLTSPVNIATDVSLSPNLVWTISTSYSGYEVKYNVYFGTTFKPAKVSDLLTGTTYTPSNLLSNTNYYWKIEADDGKGGLAESEVKTFITLLVPPSVPVLISPQNNITDVSLISTLEWNTSTTSSGISAKYNVFLDTLSIPTVKVGNMLTSTTFTTSSLISNKIYYWKIEADDGKGGVAFSEIRNFKTIGPPSIPILNNPVNDATDVSLTANLTWNTGSSSSNNNIKYKVFLDTSNKVEKLVSDMQNGTSYQTSLLSNTKYYWKIIAVDGNALVTESEVRNFKTLIKPPSIPVLNTPVDSAIIVVANTELKWGTSIGYSGNDVKYDVYLDTFEVPLHIVSRMQSGTTYSATNLKTNKTYYWKIVANDGNGGETESEVRIFKAILFEFVSVESGTFTLGCTAEQGVDCETNESPTSSVTLSTFNIGKIEVTQDQWESVMGDNSSLSVICGDCPVVSVSWYDIQNFITNLNTKSGKSYRLPTEAEWEYAARGGNKSKGYKYSGSNEINNVAWYSSNSNRSAHSVATLSPNEIGIYDMSGNVWEWCSDWYGSYTNADKTNPTGATTGTYKILRGGSWFNDETYNRITYRGSETPDKTGRNYGFRLMIND